MIVWPIATLKPKSAHVSKMSATVKGNSSISGVTQRSASDAGRWALDMEEIAITDAAKVRLWRAIEGMAEGQLNQFLVPVCERDRAPEPWGKLTGITHSDTTLFSDGAGYAQSSYTAHIVSSVTRGAVQCTIHHDNENPPEPGMGFEVGFGRYHQITKIISTGTNEVTVRVWPTFRDPVVAGDPLNFANPHLLCRLADDDQMKIPVLDYHRFAAPSVSFIEDTGPLL